MIIVAYFYLTDPNDWAEDPTFGASEMYVERGEEGDTIEHFQDTYSFQVYTFRYVQEEFINKDRPLVGRAVLVVPTLADDWMTEFLDAHADALADWGEREGL